MKSQIFLCEKKKYCPQFGLNKKILLYKLLGMLVASTCIEGFFDLGQSVDSIFFFSNFFFLLTRNKNLTNETVKSLYLYKAATKQVFK